MPQLTDEQMAALMQQLQSMVGRSTLPQFLQF